MTVGDRQPLFGHGDPQLLLFFVIYWFYGVLFETFMNGQTPGKYVLGLRVLTDSGQPINGMQATLRNLLRAADLLVPLVGLIVMTLNRKYQRLGDLVAGTIVVVEERQWLTGVAKLDDPRAIQLAAYLPPNFVVIAVAGQGAGDVCRAAAVFHSAAAARSRPAPGRAAAGSVRPAARHELRPAACVPCTIARSSPTAARTSDCSPKPRPRLPRPIRSPTWSQPANPLAPAAMFLPCRCRKNRWPAPGFGSGR